MLTNKKPVIAGLALVLGSAFALTACSGGTTSGGSTTDESSMPSMSASPSMSSSAMDPAANLVGPGCADYAAAVPSGSGSVAGMAADPVATAASNNPLLKTLTAAVSGQLNPDVNLVDTLNGSEFTVFAPVDDAFAKIPAATIDGLKTDSATLTKILTYHVIPGQLTPSEIDGTHATVEGQDVTVAGSGDAITVNGSTNVICGGVQTANATVYLIDSVLMPPTM
ncbi:MULTISPECIES: fasciclin domain-containing protein [Microbacterium]|uniref:Cell surface glycolipoprotein MPB83 n=1 Tax=Microbacterium testaceum TaxID=2033 RepID=A0A4Y3QIU3_MICTE|nr:MULTISPECIES: fasciclin domain-containing protein [Microbacterium]MDZ5144530.1 fasciclin domain-containing protein [Microbacterium testaceum]REC98412.1 putative surface protein with fasciclin (FAS1) repeats [Microbacterium sp. AG157]WJS90002.1 fasciclin domain-containing protein [Microbacterium testaceum]GEB45135.1 cell surface glycolipoprotein MPB83 [Microbacterium testaceum]